MTLNLSLCLLDPSVYYYRLIFVSFAYPRVLRDTF